jgi:osmoprotectant transport system permease protein
VIIAGLQSNNVAFILQGGLIVALLAILIHDAMISAERAVARRLGQQPRRVAA